MFRLTNSEEVKAMVTRTGYATAKGKLVHSILYPKPTDHQAVKDTVKFMIFLFIVAIGGIIYTTVVQVCVILFL